MIKNKKLKANNRNKAFFGAIIQAVGSLVGNQINREEQESQAYQTKKLLEENNQRLENNEIVNALNRNIGEGQDIYTSIRRNMKCGGKVRTKADDGLELTDTIDDSELTDNVDNLTLTDTIDNSFENNIDASVKNNIGWTNADTSSAIGGIASMINSVASSFSKTPQYNMDIQRAKMYKVKKRDFGTPKTTLVNTLDTTPNVNQGSPIQFGDRLQQAKCGIKIKRRG